MLPPGSPPAASPRSQPFSSSSWHAQSPRALTGSDDASAAALAAAFECLLDPTKAHDNAALVDLLQSLGVTRAIDLAYVDDAAALSIKALLKPAAANYFAVTIGDAMNAAKNECFAYLLDATKHSDHPAMSALLQQLGVSHPHEMHFLDDSQLGSIVALMRPVAARAFTHMMSFVRRGF
jgi:hypothetical protein